MTNVSDLTVGILKDIRDNIRELSAEQRGTNQRLDGVTERLDALTESTRLGFSGVNQRMDSVLKIVGTHHIELESRVKRLEDHLGLPREH